MRRLLVGFLVIWPAVGARAVELGIAGPARAQEPPPTLPVSLIGAAPAAQFAVSASLPASIAAPLPAAPAVAVVAPAAPVEALAQGLSAEGPVRRQASWWRGFIDGALVSAGLCGAAGCASPAAPVEPGRSLDAAPEPAPRAPGVSEERASPRRELLTFHHPEVVASDFLEERAQRLWLRGRAGAEDLPRVETADPARADGQVLSVYDDALGAGGGAALLGKLREAGPGLSTAQKLSVVQLFGRQFNQDYDNARNAAGLGAKGAVSLDALLRAAVRDRGLNPGQRGFQSAGVCRDIASAQAQMLKAFGFKDSRVVSFMDDSGVYHVTVLARDRSDPLKIYKLNYDVARSESGKDGSRALYQGARDVTLNYQVFEPEGRQVADVPSDLRKALTEASGGDVTVLDPLARTEASLASYRAALTGSRALHAGVFAGRDSTRSDFGGAEADVAYLRESPFPGRIVLALGTQHRAAERQSVDHDFAFLELEQKAVSPKIELDSSKVWFEATLNLAGTGSRTRGGENNKAWGAQGDLRVNLDAVAQESLAGGDVALSHRAGVQLGPGLSDVRNMRTITVAFNNAHFSTKARIKLGALPGDEAPLYAVASAMLAVSQLSARGELAAGLSSDKLGFLVGLEGRAARSMPVYEEGAKRRFRVTVYLRPNETVSFAGTFYRSLEGDRDAGGTVDLVLGGD